MIILSIVFIFILFKIAASLMAEQDKRHAIKREQDRQRRELREALRQNARMR